MKFEIDQYANLDSWIHRWEPKCKLIGLMTLIFSFALIEQLWLIPFMLGTTVFVYGLSRLPISFWLNRIHYPGLFLLGVVGLLPFLSGQTVIWQWGFLTLRQEGIASVILVVSRFLSIITMGMILFGTTPFLTTVRTMRSLGLPPTLADMVLLSYRYLFEMADNLAQMQQAMRLRGFHQRSPEPKYLSRLATLAGTLLVRSFEQSERIYKAMRLRGYGHHSSIMTSRRTKTGHAWSGVGLAIALVMAASFAVAEALT